MDRFINIIKVLINNLMTLILIVGIAFIVLYIIGIVPYVVESGSMEPVIERGSVSFINKNFKYEDIQINFPNISKIIWFESESLRLSLE